MAVSVRALAGLNELNPLQTPPIIAGIPHSPAQRATIACWSGSAPPGFRNPVLGGVIAVAMLIKYRNRPVFAGISCR